MSLIAGLEGQSLQPTLSRDLEKALNYKNVESALNYGESINFNSEYSSQRIGTGSHAVSVTEFPRLFQSTCIIGIPALPLCTYYCFPYDGHSFQKLK